MHQIIAKLIVSATKNLKDGEEAEIPFLVRSPKKHVRVPERYILIIFGSDDHVNRFLLSKFMSNDALMLARGSYLSSDRSFIEKLLTEHMKSIIDIDGEGINFILPNHLGSY